ncbi:MAG: hypothetical protein CSA68_03925 [Rhodobacterales bacterium]|nr:MAG: hypothetical protein CSA68_03925 [Rhodobacterales bacterium]
MARIVLIIGMCAAAVFTFDSIEYAMTYPQNTRVLTEMLNGAFLTEEAERHFLTQNIFENAELAMLITLLVLSTFLIKGHNATRSLYLSVGPSFVGVVIGNQIARTTPLRFEFLQTFLIAAIAAFAIRVCLFFLKERLQAGRV